MKSFAKLLLSAGFMLSVGPASFARADVPPPPPVTDAQIAQIVLVAHNAEIQAARSARARARGRSALEFAQMMITDHGALRLQAVRLFRKLNVIPLDSEISRNLQKKASDQLAFLRRVPSVDFDKAYILAQAKAHEEVIDLVNRILLPNAQNPEIKALVEKALPVLERHLSLAQEIQRRFGG